MIRKVDDINRLRYYDLVVNTNINKNITFTTYMSIKLYRWMYQSGLIALKIALREKQNN